VRCEPDRAAAAVLGVGRKRAGYNPNAAATLWEKMSAVGGAGPPQFMSTHPSPGNRQEKLRGLAPQMMGYYEAAHDPPTYPLQR
jgi:predicted Zn-dependent protease